MCGQVRDPFRSGAQIGVCVCNPALILVKSRAVRFLFWNINRKRVEDLIARITEEHDIDVIILAESDIPLVTLLMTVNKGQAGTYTLALSRNQRICVFSRLPEGSIRPLKDYGGVSIRHLVPPRGRDILLVGAHLPSKLHSEAEDQTSMCTRVARLVEEEENRVGHTRTIVIGDLNLNPFEPGAVAADALHGVMSRSIAQKQSRKVDGEERRFFYNPMWGRFGDATPGPAGTYYYGSAGQISYFWNTFDQVLVRPDLLNCFHDEDIKVLKKVGSVNLLTSGSEVPDSQIGSDHLPLVCNLNL